MGVVVLLSNATVSLCAATKEQKLPPEVILQHHGPVDITGQKSIYDARNDAFTVIGNAVMTQGGTVLKADQITMMRKQHIAHAYGHVHMIDPEVEIWASRADIDLAKETLELENAKILAKRNTYHLEGQRIRKLEGQKYTVLKGFFTTCGCEPGTPDWSVRADSMDVSLGQTGYAKNAQFSILGYPVIPLPYAEFPADTSRHSGFLTGREGESGLRGVQYLQPYYFAISKSQDATAAFDVETSQRIGGLGEYRLTNGKDDYFWVNAAYYNESIRSEGNRLGDVVDNQIADPQIPVNRFSIIGMTREHITPDLLVYGNAMSVSDDLYLREMDVWTLSRGYGNNFGSMRDAQSHFGLLDEFADGFARLQGTWHQDLIQAQPFALQQLPDLWVDGRRQLGGSLAYFDYDLDAVDYWRQKGLSGDRLSVNPRVTVPWRLGDYIEGFVRGGFWGNMYDASGHDLTIIPVGQSAPFHPDNGATRFERLAWNNFLTLGPLSQGGLNSRWIPFAQTGADTELERVYDVNWKYIDKLKHTIEPFVSYTYVPEISQSAVPLFDERDRINARSLVVYGFTSRLYAKMGSDANTPQVAENGEAESGAVLSADAGQGPDAGEGVGAYDTTEAAESHSAGGETTRELVSMTLMQAYDTDHAVQPGQVALSDVEGRVTLFPTSVVSFGSQFAYDPRDNPGISLASVQMNLQPPWNNDVPKLYMGKALTGSFLQFSYNYVRSANTVQFVGTSRNASQFFALRAYYDILDRIGLYFAPNYDLAASRMLSTQYGIRLKSPCDCWAFDVGITNSYNPNEVQVQVQATLGGLGSIGQSPFGRNPFAVMGLVGHPTGVLPTY